jgi:hypothetical protein
MSVKHPATVDRYARQVLELQAFAENLKEFLDSMPAPDESGSLPTMHYGHIGTLGLIHQLADEMSQAMDGYSQ